MTNNKSCTFAKNPCPRNDNKYKLTNINKTVFKWKLKIKISKGTFQFNLTYVCK